MNKIFKVVWSKSKQCYVVVSEIAKNTTGKKKIIVGAILAGLAMSSMGNMTNVVAVAPIAPVDRPSQGVANGSVKSGTTNGVAIGSSSYIDSNQSIAIGYRSYASGTFLGGNIKPSLAIGAGADARGNNTISIGTVANNAASYAVALGNESNVGSGADYGVAVGYGSSVSAQQGIAIGTNTKSIASLAMAIGNGAQASGENAISIGRTTSASGGDAVSIGTSSQATGGDAVSIGSSSQATGGDSIALGKSAKAKNGDTIAIGQDAEASLLNAVALGKTSKATGASATALGPQSTASATLATAIGMNSVANQEYATAIGGGSQATVARGVALGAYSKADTASGVAGYNANANRTNKYAGLTGNTLTSTWGAVSIGDGTNTRQMTGLAAGTKDTDAVNVAQLKSVNLAFTGDNSSSGDVNLANSKLAVTGDTTYVTTTAANQGITVKGVKKDITVSNGTAAASAGMADAKNVAEAINQANADQTITYKADGGTANSVKLSDGLNFTNGTSTVATVGANGQVTYDLNTATKKSITDSEAAVKRTISLGADSGARSSQSLNNNNVAFDVKGASGSYITTAMVGDTVTVNTTRGTIQSDASGTASLSGGDGLATAQNVATAINKAKDGAAWNLAVNTGTAQKVSGGNKVTFKDGKNISLTQSGTTITVGTTDQLTADSVTVGSGTNQIVLNGTTGEVSGKSIKTGNSTLNTNGLTISGGPSVTSTGINAGGKEIKGIADGTAADSAVSKGQMDTAIANAQTAASSTEKVVAKTLTGDNNLATVTGQTGTAKNETYEVAVSENAVKAVAANAAQDAVKVAGTGLATVSDATAAGVKTYTVNVEEGKLVLDDATGNIGAAGSTQGTTAGKDGVATTQNVAKAINDAVTKANANNAQALADATHKFGGDDTTVVSRKHGEQLNIKGGASTAAADLTDGNIAVLGDATTGTLNLKLAKSLTGLTSATYTDGAGNTQTVTGASSTITDGAGNTTSMTKGGLSTTDGTNTTTVAPNGLTATDGTNTVKVEGSGIDAGNTELKNVAAGTAATSAVNKQQMEDAVKAGGTWKITTNTGATTEVTGGDTVDFINGDNIAITNTGRNITIGTAKTVSFDKVTVGGITIDKTDGINAGGKEIKGIADATAADSAVSKGQMDTAIANAQTAATSTEKVVAKTLTGDNNLATVTGQTGTAKNETYEVAVSENAVKAVAVNAAQDAVKVAGTGLATVSDATTAGVKTYTVNVEEGKLVLDDATGAIGAAGSTQGTTAGKDGVATTQNVAKAINEAVTKANANNAQALADAEHKFDGDTGTTSVRKHGEVLSIKGGVTTPADLTTGNIGVVSDGAGTLNVKLAKALTGLTSATYTDGAGNTQTVTGASSTITDGAGNTTSMTKGGLSTTDGTNTTTVAPNGLTATDGTNTVKVEGSGIDAGNTELKNVAAGTAATSAVNKQQMEDAVKAGGTWKITTNTGATTEVTGGDTVDFINGDNIAITNTGRNITIGTAKTVSFDKVTVGGITIDKTDGINAGGKEIKGIADATAADSAVSKGQMDTAIANAQTAATSTEKVVAKTLTGDNNLATVTGQTGTAKNETYEVAVSENAVKAVATNAAQDAVKVAGTGLATVSDATTAGVKTYTVNVEEGKLVLDDATGAIGAAGSTQGTTAGKDGVATTQNVAKAINEAVTKANANNAQALADAEHKFDGDTGTTSVRKHGEVLSVKGGVTTPNDLTTGNIGVVSDGAGTLNVRLAKALTGLTSATYTDATGNTTTVTGGTTTIADAAGNTQTLAPTKSEIKDNAGVSTVTTKDGVTATDAAGNTTALTNGGVSTTDGAGNTTALTKGGLSTTDGTNTTTVAPTGMTATDGTHIVKVEGTGIDAGNTEIKNVAAGTTNTSAVNKKQMDDAISKATGDATHEFGGDDTTVVSRKHGEKLNIKGGASTTAADLTDGNIAVLGDATTGTLNLKLAKALTGLTSATYTDATGNTTTVTGGTTTIADAAGNTQTLAPTKSEIKDNAGVSTVTTKDGVTAKDAAGNTTALTNGGVNTTDAAGNTTALTNGGVSATDGAGNTTALTKGGLSTTDGTNTTTVTPTGMTATDGTNTVKVEGSGIDAGNTEIKNVAAGTTNTSAVNKKQMDDAISKATGDATHEFGGDDTTVVSRKHGEQLNIKGGASTAAADLTDGNIAVLGDATTGTLNLKLAKALTGLTSATYTDAAGNTTTVTGGSTTIADAAGNTQTLAPTKSEIKDNTGVSTVTTKDGVTAKDAAGNTTALTNGGVSTTDGAGNTTALTKGGLSTTDGTNTTTVTPTGMTATDGTNTVKVEGSGIDAGNTEIKNVAAGTTNTSAVNKKQMDDAISKATGDATHEFGGDDTTVVSRKHGEKLNIKGGASTTAADLTDGNIAVLGDATTGTLNLKLAKALTGLTSATYTDAAGNTTTVTGGSTTIADAAGNTQTLAPTKSEIKDNAGVSTVTTKDGVTAKDAAGNTTALTNGGVSATDGAGNTTALTKGGLSTTDGTNTTTVTPTGMTATDGTNTVKVNGSGIDAGNTEIKNVAAGTTATSAVNKKQMDDAISKATGDATHEFGGDAGNTSVRKHGEVLSIKGGVTDTTKLSDNNIGVVSDGAGTLNVKLAKDLVGLNSATYTDAAGNTTTVTGGTTTIADAAGNTQTLAPTKSEIKDNTGVSTVTTKDGVTAKDAAGNTTALTKGGLSTTDGTNTTTVTPDGLTATDGTNTVKVNGSGIDAGNTEIKNVADGTTSHSAINKNQLDTAVNRLQNATDNISLNIAGNNGTGNIKLKDQVLHIDGTNGITTKANGQSLTVGLDDATMSTINNTAALANNAAKKDLSNIDQAGKEVIKDTAAWHVKVNSMAPETVKGGDTVTFNDGHNITITNTGKDITVATKKEVTFDKVSVGGITIDKQADHISGVSSITGSGSDAPTMTFNAANGSTPSSVSMDSNLDMGGKQINNVAAATRPTDAVNKQQVDQAMKSLAGMADSAAKKYASKAGANAAALAALKPIQYDPLAPTQIMAGIGNYKSQTAVALGVAHYSNEDTMFNIGASLDSHDTMLNAGVTHKFGSSAERKNIPDRYKGGPISSIYVMQDEVSALKAQNSEMQAMLDKQSTENAAIIAENKMLREQNEEMQRKVDLILSKLQ